MATQGPNLAVTFKAGEDMSSQENRFVCMSADMTVKYSTQFPTIQSVGVLDNAPDGTTEEARVIVAGIAKVELGGTLSAGARVAAEEATGKAIAVSATYVPAGVLLTGGNSGDLATVLLSSQSVV